MFLNYFFLTILLAVSIGAHAEDESGKLNFLFIAVDDLRPEINALGDSQAVTPHIDRLAAGGISFTRHYVQAPTCGASRLALLSGRLPTHRRHLHNQAMRAEIADAESHDYITFPRYLRDNGFRTIALGKISHYPGGIVAPNRGPNPNPRPELPGAWDISWAPSDRWGTEQNGFFGYADGSSRNSLDGEVPPFEAADVDDTGYPDGQIARRAVDQIGKLAESGQPFLLAVGFYKPHLPFNAPLKYWDLYEREDITLSPNPRLPAGLTETNTLHGMGEFNRYKLGREKAVLGRPFSDAYARELRHGYLAATSYIDAQVGKLLDALESHGLADNTVVILWGDHGWHLGDHTMWGKHTLYERALRSPLIVRTPGPVSPGAVNAALVESVDIYPTITDLAGLPRPPRISGKNLLTGSDRQAARSFWRDSVSLRSDRFRIIVNGERFPEDVELYDHRFDPNETKNVVTDHPEAARELFRQARKLALEQNDAE